MTERNISGCHERHVETHVVAAPRGSGVFLLLGCMLLLPASCGDSDDSDPSFATGGVSSTGGGSGMGAPPMGGDEGCFAEGTRVATPAGARRIEELRVGDAVLSWDEELGRVVPNRIQAVRELTREVGALGVGPGTTISVTADHPFFEVFGHAYLEAGSLSEGASLLSLGYGWESPDALSLASARVPFATTLVGRYDSGVRIARVRDLSVGRPHNFFAEGILVHNKGYEPCTTPREITICAASMRELDQQVPGYALVAGTASSASNDPEGDAGVAGAGGQGGVPGTEAERFVVSALLDTNCRFFGTSAAGPLAHAWTTPKGRFSVFEGDEPCEQADLLSSGRADDNGLLELPHTSTRRHRPVTIELEVEPGDCAMMWGPPLADDTVAGGGAPGSDLFEQYAKLCEDFRTSGSFPTFVR